MRRLLIIFSMVIILCPIYGYSQFMTNGKDLFRVQSGETVGRKTLAFNLAYSSTFQDSAMVGGSERLSSFNTMTVSATYGLINRFDVMLEVTPWQNDFVSNAGNPLGQTRIGFKWELPQQFGRNIHFGVQGFGIHSPIDRMSVPFEQYASDGLAYGGSLLNALDLKVWGVPTKTYLNFGYVLWPRPDDSLFDKTDQILIGGGIKLAFRKMVLLAEYSREQFVETNEVMSGKEQPSRLALGARLPVSQTVSIDLGYQFNMAKDDGATPYPGEYHDWKFMAAFKKVFFFEMDEEKRNRMLLMERIRQEEAERLQSLEKERKEVEDEIDKLKRLIEEGQ